MGTMANWLWEAQDTSEAIATIAEAHAQQQRALRELIADVLAVVEALGLIDYAPCPKRCAHLGVIDGVPISCTAVKVLQERSRSHVLCNRLFSCCGAV